MSKRLKSGARVKFLVDNNEHEGVILGFINWMICSIWAYNESSYSEPQVYYVDHRNITAVAHKHKFISIVDDMNV